MATQKDVDGKTRNQLAVGIVLFSAAAVAILGAIAIWNDTDKSDQVLGQILPLLGTWVGTVIAFYFAKDNLESAARTTKEILTLEGRLKGVKVEEAMIPIGSVEGLRKVTKCGDIDSLKVSEVLTEMKRNRLPIVDEHGALCLIVHKSTLTEFLTTQALEGNAKPKDLTFKEFKAADKPLYTKLKAFAFISSADTLSEAKRSMEEHSKDCADVFVTASGQSSEPVLGWITNAEIGRRSQA